MSSEKCYKFSHCLTCIEATTLIIHLIKLAECPQKARSGRLPEQLRHACALDCACAGSTGASSLGPGLSLLFLHRWQTDSVPVLQAGLFCLHRAGLWLFVIVLSWLFLVGGLISVILLENPLLCQGRILKPAILNTFRYFFLDCQVSGYRNHSLFSCRSVQETYIQAVIEEVLSVTTCQAALPTTDTGTALHREEKGYYRRC